MIRIARQLGDYARSVRFRDLDDQVLLEAKKRVLDALGCAIGAFNEKPVGAARRVAEQIYSGRLCSILGTKSKTTPDVAAFVNGGMIRYFDFNDTYLSREPAHPSDNISACLSLAEMRREPGKEFLLAMVLAYEVQCRLCDAASLRSRGWDHVCYGLASTCVAAGVLLGLSSEKIENAINISLNSHIAMRQVRSGELSDWKGFSFANASRNAVFSSLLAREGITGPSPIFEGEMGFFRQVSGEFDLDFGSSFGGRNGALFKLPETYIKYYPAEYHAQSAIWAALEARSEISDTNMIESVEIETHEAGYTILGKDREKWSPKTRETADHSLPFIVGSALLYGRVDNSSYSTKKLSAPEMLRLLGKISVREDPNLTLEYPEKIANRIVVRLADGKVITKQVDVPKGHPKNPMTSEEVEAKFRRLTKRFLKQQQVERIFEFVWNLEKQKDVSPLLGLCAVTK